MASWSRRTGVGLVRRDDAAAAADDDDDETLTHARFVHSMDDKS